MITMLLKKRVCLRRLFVRDCLLERIEHLTPEYLLRSQIQLLLLDFDGVLSSHGAIKPTESVINWLKQLDSHFSLKKVCIYSNNLFTERVRYIESTFPEIHLMHFLKKKPYPDDLLRLLQTRQLSPSDVLVVDDRITSGILSACIIGTEALLPRKAVVDYRGSFVKECFYSAVRFLERVVVRL